MEYIEIDKDEIPYRFTIDLADEEFEFEINYNNRFDFFTIDLYKDGRTLVVGEKLILDRPLFTDLVDIELPKVTITPKDRSNNETRITYDNLEKTAFLFVE
ncbi:hypothetical protein ABZ756_02080 [Mammaliicoccus sciuri]